MKTLNTQQVIRQREDRWGNMAGTNQGKTEEAKLNIIHTRLGTTKIKQEVTNTGTKVLWKF